MSPEEVRDPSMVPRAHHDPAGYERLSPSAAAESRLQYAPLGLRGRCDAASVS